MISQHGKAQKLVDGSFPPLSWRLFCHQHEWFATAAEQIPRPYACADDHPITRKSKTARAGDPDGKNAHALNGRFGMTPLSILQNQRSYPASR
jgi:hypothetical protein